MWNECERFVESKAKTNKLLCSDCGKKIIKGEEVIFRLSTVNSRRPMKDVYCSVCKEEYESCAIDDTQHPFDLDG